MLEAKSRDGNNTVAGEARADGGLQRRQQHRQKLLMTFLWSPLNVEGRQGHGRHRPAVAGLNMMRRPGVLRLMQCMLQHAGGLESAR